MATETPNTQKSRHVSLPRCVAAMFYFNAFPSEKALPTFSPITR